MEPVPQSGLIIDKPKPTLWGLGGETGIAYQVALPSGDWRVYEPTPEAQAHMFVFDTQGCTNFSYNNVVETRLNALMSDGLAGEGKMNDAALAFLKQNGYIDANGKVNFSDKYTFIRSGTTKNGNNMQTVCEKMHDIGLIPESMLPSNIEATNTWEAWADPAQITPAMDALAKQFLRYFELPYQMVFYDDQSGFDPVAAEACEKFLKQSPLQFAIPRPAHHAIEATRIVDAKEYDLFDSYAPYDEVKKWSDEVHYAMAIVVRQKVVAPAVPVSEPAPNWILFTRPINFGTVGEDVFELQRLLKKLGYFNATPTGGCYKVTVAAIRAFQAASGVPQTGTAWTLTLQALKDALAAPTRAVSAPGRGMIKAFEGLHDGNPATAALEPQKDPAGLPTIGWGARYDKDGNAVTMSTPAITLADADALFDRDLKRFEDAVNKAVRNTVTQGQFDALVSLAYNVGTASFLASNLLQHVATYTVTRADFLEYVHAHVNGQLVILPGLVKRRNAEADLYGVA